MALSMVKEQLTHFKTKKVNEGKCKDPLAWWRTHKVPFSYVGFVTQQILGIVESHVVAKNVFNVISICTNR
jgi:hypothetical protein